MQRLTVYGPPGTGKTTSAIKWLTYRCHSSQIDPTYTAFISFTTAACNDARNRYAEYASEHVGREIQPEELYYCRTIHSLASRAVTQGMKQDWLADSKLWDFRKLTGYDISGPRYMDDDLEALFSAGGKHYPAMFLWTMGRNIIVDPDPQPELIYHHMHDRKQIPSKVYEEGGIDWYVQIIRAYEAWKQSNGLLDYTDLLTRSLTHSAVQLPLTYAVVDEAQDLSPLLWAVADRLTAKCDEVLTVGDDDQAIYGFAGASAELLNSRPADKKIVLSKSWRLPAPIHALAMRKSGDIKNRQPKAFAPADHDGEVTTIKTWKNIDLNPPGKILIMGRNWANLKGITRTLNETGTPYRLAGGRIGPWDDKNLMQAVHTMMRLNVPGIKITGAELKNLSALGSTQTKARPGIWKHGTKASILAVKPTDVFTLQDLLDLGLTELGLKHLLSRSMDLFPRAETSKEGQAALMYSVENGKWTADPKITVSSIHAQKGLECDTVYLLQTAGRTAKKNLYTPEDRDEELRIQYVGITRAKKNLILVKEDMAYPI